MSLNLDVMSMDAHWYALKVFYGKAPLLRDELTRAGIETYYPVLANGKPYVQSLLFVRCREQEIVRFHSDSASGSIFSIYTHRQKRRRLYDGEVAERIVPAPIDDREMAVFMLVTSASPDSYEILGPDEPKYHCGQLVRVLGGPFEGLVGRVKRIKKDRRLVVAITGVIAVATVHIDPRLLENVEEADLKEEQFGATRPGKGFVGCSGYIIRRCSPALG